MAMGRTSIPQMIKPGLEKAKPVKKPKPTKKGSK